MVNGESMTSGSDSPAARANCEELIYLGGVNRANDAVDIKG